MAKPRTAHEFPLIFCKWRDQCVVQLRLNEETCGVIDHFPGVEVFRPLPGLFFRHLHRFIGKAGN